MGFECKLVLPTLRLVSMYHSSYSKVSILIHDNEMKMGGERS